MENEQQGVEEKPSVAAEETPSQAEAPSAPEASDDEMPNEPEKAREAFIKMRQELKALKSEKKEAPASVSALDDVGDPFLDELEQSFQQPTTPETDVNTILQQVELSKRAALEAIRETQSIRMERENQMLFKEFPTLDSSSETWDKNFDNLVASRMMLANRLGKRIAPIEAARLVKQELDAYTGKAREEASQQTKENISRKETATLEATGSSAAATREKTSGSPEYLEALRDRVRRGDTSAQIEYDKIIFGE